MSGDRSVASPQESSPATEFDLIERWFSRPASLNQKQDSGTALGIGDDAALLDIPVGMQLVVSMDTLVAGVHFPLDTHPEDIGHKSLAVSLSDMAAMGAEPRWATLALTVPQRDEAWLTAFSNGFFALARRFNVQLVGGDTTRGPLSITVQMHGLVPRGQGLLRAGAHLNDLIYVTGELGDAGLALRLLKAEVSLIDERLLARLNWPEPRIHEGIALRGIASAAIDISDGLAADLGHILTASGVGASLQLASLPLSQAVADCTDWSLPLSAGDDYELCFTLNPRKQANLLAIAESCGYRFSCIGVIEHAPGLRCMLPDGELFMPDKKGYDHFGSSG